ncbi:hypothetical protein AMTR_s00085p00086210 [Amborella trichopoda]|uniref:Uncharacterized protein n=1 Tax=Amborella trichopoda TaxID=13333 RepID=W1NYK6_AMBTC|nr:hypothetical protein AMTR_s00085p00086210 [Amborella trichopoda]
MGSPSKLSLLILTVILFRSFQAKALDGLERDTHRQDDTHMAVDFGRKSGPRHHFPASRAVSRQLRDGGLTPRAPIGRQPTSYFITPPPIYI